MSHITITMARHCVCKVILWALNVLSTGKMCMPNVLLWKKWKIYFPPVAFPSPICENRFGWNPQRVQFCKDVSHRLTGLEIRWHDLFVSTKLESLPTQCSGSISMHVEIIQRCRCYILLKTWGWHKCLKLPYLPCTFLKRNVAMNALGVMAQLLWTIWAHIFCISLVPGSIVENQFPR